jgi:MFS superfamily sulfate permease-like transporter
MSNKFFCTVIMYGVSMASFYAQAPGAFHSAPMEQTPVAGVVDELTQHALFALLGAIVLSGAIYFAFVWKHCNDLNTKRKNINAPSMTIVLFVTGLSAFGSSCSVEQRAIAAQYRAAEAAEYRHCPSPYQHGNYANIPFNNRNPSSGHGSSCCRYCGKRIDY